MPHRGLHPAMYSTCNLSCSTALYRYFHVFSAFFWSGLQRVPREGDAGYAEIQGEIHIRVGE